jgi:flagellar protein FliL
MAEEDSESGKSKSKKIIIIIIVLLILLAGAGNGAYFLLFKTNSEEEIEAETSGIVYPLFTPSRNYTINLRDGKHLLHLSLVAVLEDDDWEAFVFLTDQYSLFDDMVTSFVSDMTAEDLETHAGTDLLKRELLKKTNNLFTKEILNELESGNTQPVKEILFSQFLID